MTNFEMVSGFMIFFLLYAWAVSAVMAGILAHHKGRSVSNWVLCSVFMGVGAFFLLWSLPIQSVQKVTINRGLDEAELSSTTQQEDVNTEETKNVVVGALPFLLVLLGLVVVAILSI